MIDELEWVKRELPIVDAPSAEARAAARTALEKAIEREQHRRPPRARLRRGRVWLAPAIGLVVTAAVVAVFLGVQRPKPVQPGAKGGLELVFRAEPSAEAPVVSHAAVAGAVSVLRARLAPFLSSSRGTGSVTSTGDTIFVHLGGVRLSRALVETLGNPGALLVFYDWESNVLTPNGRPVADLLGRGDSAALQISQGGGSAAPGSPGAGSMSLYLAVTLASRQPVVSNAQCERQRCARFGPEYFAFAAPGTAHCPAGQPCYLAGPASSPSDLRAKLPLGVSLSHAHTLVVPQGTVVLQAVASSGFGHTPPWSDPSAQYFVLRDRASLFSDEITNPRQSLDQSGSPDVTFGFTSKGASDFQQVTSLISHRGEAVSHFGQSYPQHFAVALGTQLLTIPSIDFKVYPDGISAKGGADLTGGFTVRSARQLASQLRVPPLPVRLQLLSVSPTPGASSSPIPQVSVHGQAQTRGPVTIVWTGPPLTRA